MSPVTHDDVMKHTNDGWHGDDAAEKYALAENATRPFADIMAEKAGFDSLNSEANVLDLACGTGAVAAALYSKLPKEKWGNVKVLGGDVSEPMLKYLRERGEREGWSGLETAIVDGKNIQLPKSTYTHLFANFAVFVLPPTTLATCHSLLKPGGFVGISSWTHFPWYDTVRIALSRLPSPQPPLPAYEEVQTTIYAGNPWYEESHVRKVLDEAGFEGVEVVKDKFRVSCGTSAQFADTMSMPLNMLSGWWEEGRRAELVKATQEELRKVASENAGGDDKEFFMEFEAFVGTGRKAA